MSNSKRKKIEITKNKVKRYIELLESDGFAVQNAYLYGSYAIGDFRENSDIDVCVVSNKFQKDWDANDRYLWRKAWRVDSRIEPIGYTSKEFREGGIPLISEIKKTGIRIL